VQASPSASCDKGNGNSRSNCFGFTRHHGCRPVLDAERLALVDQFWSTQEQIHRGLMGIDVLRHTFRSPFYARGLVRELGSACPMRKCRNEERSSSRVATSERERR